MLQKVAEILYEKVEDRTVKSADLTEKVANLFPGKSVNKEIVTQIISDYGKRGTGLEESAKQIIDLIEVKGFDPFKHEGSRVVCSNTIVPEGITIGSDGSFNIDFDSGDPDDETLFFRDNFSEPEYVAKLVSYLRKEKSQVVDAKEIEELCDCGETHYTINGETYMVMNKESAYEVAIDCRTESIIDNAAEQAYEDIHYGGEELCWYLGYNEDVLEDDEIVIFKA